MKKIVNSVAGYGFSNINPVEALAKARIDMKCDWYNLVKHSSFLPDDVKIVKSKPPIAKNYGDILPGIYVEKYGAGGEQISVGICWARTTRKIDNLKGICVLEYFGNANIKETKDILKQSYFDVFSKTANITESSWNYICKSVVIPNKYRYGYVLAGLFETWLINESSCFFKNEKIL